MAAPLPQNPPALSNPHPDSQHPHPVHSSHTSTPAMGNGVGSRTRPAGDPRNLLSKATSPTATNGSAMPVPSGSQPRGGNGQQRNNANMAATHPFDGPRSPPGAKNTSHVPCKFFRQGACQAGKACPFSHAVDATSAQTPCKYFSRGNCKFGAKCALAHVLPDGRRVNRHNLSMGGGHLNLGGRVNPENYHNQGSALANSLLQANMVNGPFGPQYPYQSKEDMSPSQNHPTQYFDSIPTIDTSFPVSNPGSKYGSPRDDMRLPVSPVSKGLSVLDAPLPASFDSNGVSWIARNGPVAASVPSKFGLDSPSLSYKETAALKNLHDSAFGQDGRSRPNNTASSPPGPGEVAGLRPMHSQRVSKPKTMSASVPRAGTVDEWDGNFTFEEDFLPNSLQELFTPQEKMRRLSRSGGDDDGVKIRSGLGSPGEPSSKIGSPTASSPSRFGALFARQKKDEDAAGPTSGFGHVGSPLRNSSLTLGSSPGVRSTTRPTSGDMSPYFASPPRQSSMSMISQQLQRTRLSRNDSGGGGTSSNTNGGSGLDSGLHPSSARAGANGRMDRPVSASTASLGTGRAVASIDEEPAEVFSMEEEEDTKRYSGGFAYPTGGRSPQFGTIGAGRSISGSGVPVSSPPEGREGKEYLEALYRNGGQ